MPSKREAFNFYVSYYDTYMMLNDKEKIEFMNALLDKQFQGIEPNELSGLSLFAYKSQKFSIDKQVKGWEDSRKEKLTPLEVPLAGVVQPPSATPWQQVQEKGKGEVEGKEEEEVEEEEEWKGELEEIIAEENSAISHTANSEVESLNSAKNLTDVATKKNKVPKKEFAPPSLEEVIAYFSSNGYSQDAAKRAFNYYAVADWTDSKGSKVKNWKQKMLAVWFKPENKSQVQLPTYSPSKPTGFQFM